MGARGKGPWPRAKKIVFTLSIAFAILTGSIVAFALVAEGTYTPKSFNSHSPIYIDGNADFGLGEGVTGGSGTEADPFVIEGWEISVAGACGISVNNTDAYLVIRNVSLSASWAPYISSSSPVGISLDNASNVKIESSFISYFQSGVRANGTRGVTECIEISRCTFTVVSQHVLISNTSDCLVTHSSFYNAYDYVLRISNCTSVACSFNEIVPLSYAYFRPPTKTIRIENVTSCTFEENDISSVEYDYCVWAVDTNDATITNNSVECRDQWDFVAERCTRILISRNEMSTGEGIWVLECSNASVDANLLHTDWRGGPFQHIFASNSVDVVISGNAMIRGGGIWLTDTRDSWVHDNYVADTGYFASSSDHVKGMVIYQCRNLTISRNVIVNGTSLGLDLSVVVKVTVEGNEISGNIGAGLMAQGSNLSIRYNKIFSNTIGGTIVSPGVFLSSCTDSTFEGNNISDAVEVNYCDNLMVRSNTFDGEWNLWTTSVGETTNFQQNNFLVGVDIMGNSSMTHWDAGYPDGGNYWLSYIGEDLMSGPNQDIPGPDGFGDTAYPVSGEEMDRYPRMQPVSVQDLLPPTTIAVCNGSLGKRMWYTSNVSVSLRAFDSNTSSLDVRYSLDSLPWSVCTSEILVTGDGIHKLQFKAEDGQGNLEETKTAEIRIDAYPPSPASAIQSEYRFRTKTSDIRYIDVDFADGQSGVSYASAMYNSAYWGYNYPGISYSSCDWITIVPENGKHNMTIVAVDGAGNTYTHVVTVSGSVSPNTDPFSPKGPYGWWLILATLVDIGVGVAALRVRHDARLARNRWTPRDEGGRHYDEDVVDGYPKFQRRM